MTTSDTLHARLRAAVEQRLSVARAAGGAPWGLRFGHLGYVGAHIAANDPAAVIRQCEALLRVAGLAEEANNIDEGLDLAKRVGVRDLVAEPLIGDLIVRVLAAGEGIEVGDG